MELAYQRRNVPGKVRPGLVNFQDIQDMPGVDEDDRFAPAGSGLSGIFLSSDHAHLTVPAPLVSVPGEWRTWLAAR